MIELKLAIIWGAKFDEIKNYLDRTEELNINLFTSSLRYSNKKDEKIEKTKYISSLKDQIKKINKEVKTFNEIVEFAFGKKSKVKKLPLINFSVMRKIILKHKGDYPAQKDLKGITDELLGRGDSPSSLSIRHTSLQLKNTLMPLRIGLTRFVESLETLREPFQEYISKKEKLRKVVENEIEKSLVCYSVGLKGEAVFIVGRVLENLCAELLKILKKQGALELKNIKIENIDFDTKLNLLHYKLKKMTPGQHSKAMSLKWDRNTFGHVIGKLNLVGKDSEATISTGVNLVFLFENKIRALTNKKKSRQ